MKWLCFFAVLLIAPPARAQTGPHWEQPPLYGTHGTGLISLEAGGDTASGLTGCTGYINATQPDVNVKLETAAQALTLQVGSLGDTVLVVYTADQQWLCADDVSDTQLNPVLTIQNATEGEYNIWVGTADPSKAIAATLTAQAHPLLP